MGVEQCNAGGNCAGERPDTFAAVSPEKARDEEQRRQQRPERSRRELAVFVQYGARGIGDATEPGGPWTMGLPQPQKQRCRDNRVDGVGQHPVAAFHEPPRQQRQKNREPRRIPLLLRLQQIDGWEHDRQLPAASQRLRRHQEVVGIAPLMAAMPDRREPEQEEGCEEPR